MKEETTVAAAPDPNAPIDLKMVRSANLILDQNDGGRSLVVGKGMANGGNVDGAVTRMRLFPNGTILVEVTKANRFGSVINKQIKSIVLRGDLEAEVMFEDERAEREASGWTIVETLAERQRRNR